MQATIDTIVAATSLPLSIIIVGVGNADFANMNVLDADDVALKSSITNKYMERDIVQFVAFRDFKNSHYSVLAKELLAEIPTQFLSYMKKNNIVPRPQIMMDNSIPQFQQQQNSSNYQNPPPTAPDYSPEFNVGISSAISGTMGSMNAIAQPQNSSFYNVGPTPQPQQPIYQAPIQQQKNSSFYNPNNTQSSNGYPQKQPQQTQQPIYQSPIQQQQNSSFYNVGPTSQPQ